MIAGLVNPSGTAIKEVYRQVACPKQAMRIKELEAELAAKPMAMMAEPLIEIRETVKEVVKEDASLIEKLNLAYREIAELKGRVRHMPMRIEPKVEIRTEVKEVDRVVTKLVFKKDWKTTAMAAAASAAAAGLAAAHFF